MSPPWAQLTQGIRPNATLSAPRMRGGGQVQVVGVLPRCRQVSVGKPSLRLWGQIPEGSLQMGGSLLLCEWWALGDRAGYVGSGPVGVQNLR